MRGIAFLIAISTTLYAFTTTVAPDPTERKANFAAAETVVQHQLGGRNISFKVVQYGSSTSTCCINVHDNEATAVLAAKAILEQQGGTLIKIENNAQRYISFSFKGVQYSFDPNRIFSAVGIKQTLKANGKIHPLAIAEVEKFASHLLLLIPDSAACIIALHNNTDGDYSVKTYQPGGKRQFDAMKVYADTWQDVDDIALTTDENLFNKMSGFGYNSILQDNIKVNKDGSLSVYYGELNRRYINIETQFGKTEQYKQMLAKLVYYLEEEKSHEPITMIDPDGD